MANSAAVVNFTTWMPGLVDISDRQDPFALHGFTSTDNKPDSLHFSPQSQVTQGLSQAYFQLTALNHMQIQYFIGHNKKLDFFVFFFFIKISSRLPFSKIISIRTNANVLILLLSQGQQNFNAT